MELIIASSRELRIPWPRFEEPIEKSFWKFETLDNPRVVSKIASINLGRGHLGFVIGTENLCSFIFLVVEKDVVSTIVKSFLFEAVSRHSALFKASQTQGV